ncbi:bifunctional lysylphosphatidylglycerol flippase/synthetase MprF [Pseudokineococcus sp. 1T1Z-3]|uniref:bifunctional lysylphosphatidylglycerol flippase/synthetase MprF n=1 Tax=Pseudokineococcus sp. 1T1Z-3 TaxID=3132745 RepID=UPI00309E07F1
MTPPPDGRGPADHVERRDRRRRAAALVCAAAGALALTSAVLPPARGRLADLLALTPFAVPATAAGLTALVGCLLLVLARGLRRGSRLAWGGSVVALAAVAVLHVVKGLDVEEALVTAAALAWLATQGRAFPVRASRAALARAAGLAVLGTLAALALSAGLAVGYGGHQHARDLDESVEQAAARLVGVEQAQAAGVPVGLVPGVGPASARVLPLAGAGLATSALWLALAPPRARALTPQERRRERERAREVVRRHGGDTLAYFALRDDKDWYFTGSTVVAHAVRGDTCLVSPDPVGPPEELAAAWADFRAYAERNGWTVVVVGAAPDALDVYRGSGMHAVYLGDEAILDCQTFSLAGRHMKSLRQAVGRVGRAGITTTFTSPGTIDPALRAELVAMSGQSRRGEAERGFSMTLSRLADPADDDLLLAVARDAAQQVVGFVQWVPAAGIDGWSLDVMRRRTDADLPNGVVDAMVVATAEHLRERGQRGLGLNFAVLRTVVSGEAEGRLPGAARALLTRLGGHAQVESLWRFNAKYDPAWRPRYVVVDSLAALAGDGLAVARAEGVVGELPVVGSLAPVRTAASRLRSRAHHVPEGSAGHRAP